MNWGGGNENGREKTDRFIVSQEAADKKHETDGENTQQDVEAILGRKGDAEYAKEEIEQEWISHGMMFKKFSSREPDGIQPVFPGITRHFR